MLFAHAIAQAEALLIGRNRDEVEAEMRGRGIGEKEIDRVAPHRTFSGNRPSSFWLWDRLDPYALGQCIELHEHRIFVQGVLLGVYSFDQWGVELGKGLADQILNDLSHPNKPARAHDASTEALMREFSDLAG